MSTSTAVNPTLDAIAAVNPPAKWSTPELLHAARGHLSERLEKMIGTLGVDTRYSILANYTDVLFNDAEPKLAISATTLAIQSARACLDRSGVDPAEIGLVLGVSSSPGRLLPSLVCDLIAGMPELPRTVPNLSIEYMGCSAMAKVVETARWFLTAHPDQRVLVTFMDAITPLSPTLPGHYRHFSEIDPSQRQSTVDALHGFLFGDGAVSMVLSATGSGPVFGPVSHLTNELAEDTELGTVPDGGSDIPVVMGRRLYTLSAGITERGTHYALETIRALIAGGECALKSPGEASLLLMHTGSGRILDGLCEAFGVDNHSPAVASSYRVLRDHGNTIGCSVPLMLAEPVHRPPGTGLLVTFGLSFSCGAFSIDIPEGGWRP